jgi:uncharacterized protein
VKIVVKVPEYTVFFDRYSPTPYYCALMSTGTPEKPLPRRLDPRKLAHQGAVFSGIVPVNSLPRLQEAVATVRRVVADIEFGLGDQREKVVQGRVCADLDVVCQRCLEPFGAQVTSDFTLAVVWSEEDARQLPATYEPWITGEGEGDLYEVLEEELLLSLPVVSFHQEECTDKALFSSGDLPEDASEKKPNPFQVLKQLKGNTKT